MRPNAVDAPRTTPSEIGYQGNSPWNAETQRTHAGNYWFWRARQAGLLDTGGDTHHIGYQDLFDDPGSPSGDAMLEATQTGAGGQDRLYETHLPRLKEHKMPVRRGFRSARRPSRRLATRAYVKRSDTREIPKHWVYGAGASSITLAARSGNAVGQTLTQLIVADTVNSPGERGTLFFADTILTFQITVGTSSYTEPIYIFTAWQKIDVGEYSTSDRLGVIGNLMGHKFGRENIARVHGGREFILHAGNAQMVPVANTRYRWARPMQFKRNQNLVIPILLTNINKATVTVSFNYWQRAVVSQAGDITMQTGYPS